MMNHILIEERVFTYKGIEYEYFIGKNNLHFLGKVKRFIILGEDIFRVEMSISSKKSIDSEIEERILSEFKGDKDYLFNYERIKGNTYRIIAIKGGGRIEMLCSHGRGIKIIPVQHIMVEIIKKKIKSKEFSFIVDLKGCFYYVKVEGCKGVFSLVSKDQEGFKRKIKKYLEDDGLYYEVGVAEKLKYKGGNTFNLNKKGEDDFALL